MIYHVDKIRAEVIPLGRRGENLAKTVKINVQPWLDRWPEAALSIIVLRPGESEGYAAQNIFVENGILHWTITNVETSVPGVGTFEIAAKCGDVLKKSVSTAYEVCPSIWAETDPADPPLPVTPWYSQAMDAAAAAEKSAQQAASCALEAENAVLQPARDIDALQDAAAIDLIGGALWEIGSIHNQTGENMNSTTRIRTVAYIPLTGVESFTLSVDTGYKFVIDWYDENDQLLMSLNENGIWQTQQKTYSAFGSAVKVRLLVADTGDGAAAIDYAAHLHVTAYTRLINTVNRHERALTLSKDNYDFAFEHGSLSTDKGTDYAATGRIRSKYIALAAGSVIKTDASFKNLSVFTFDKNKAFLASSAWADNEYVLPQDGYARVVLRKDSANTGIAESEFDSVCQGLLIYPAISIALSENNYTKAETDTKFNVIFVTNGAAGLSTFEPDGTNGVYYKAGAQLLIRGAYTYTFTFEEVFADLLTTSPSGVEGCILIPHNGSLIFNPAAKTLEVVSSLDVGDNYAIFKVGLQGAVSGIVDGLGLKHYQDWLLETGAYEAETVFTAQRAPINAHFEPCGAGGLYLSIPGEWYIRGLYSYNYSYAAAFAGLLTTSPMGVENCIHIPHNASLIFNTATKKLEIVSGLDAGANIAIFKVGMGNALSNGTDGVIGGIGQWYYLHWQAAQYIADHALPQLWINEVETSIQATQAHMMTAGAQGESFLFITDLHWDNNAGYSPCIAAALSQRLGIPRIVLGGDYIAGGEKSASALLMSHCLSAFRKIPAEIFPLFGNHDSNAIGAPSTDDHFTKGGAFSLIHPHLRQVTYGAPCYFSADNDLSKTRYIFLDTGLEGEALSSQQQDFLESALSTTPSGYRVLIFGHIIYRPDAWDDAFLDTMHRTPFMDTVCALCDAFNAAADGREVAGIFGGHVHTDLHYTTDGGIPIILCDCDARHTLSGIAVSDSAITSQCVSVVTVDYANRQLHITRVGRGSDSTFSF